LNHNVPIPSEVVAIHGYTQRFLREHGLDPFHVYELFRDYAQDYPMVAHNLSFDWNRCLVPEWGRLGISEIGRRGFCTMTLARRLVHGTGTYRLEVLKECFGLSSRQSHRAENDVLTVVDLFKQVYRPRLESADLDTFKSIAAFSRRTPVAKCLELIGAC
jgi:DNA polymerase III epsilon subunit-like protein